MAYKLMKHLNQEERETVHLNLTGKNKWTEVYRELWCDPKVPQEAAEDIRADMDVDSITFEEVEGALSPMKNRKAPGVDGIHS